MKRIPLPVAVLLLIAAFAFAYYWVTSSPWLDYGRRQYGEEAASRRPGPTPEQIAEAQRRREASEKTTGAAKNGSATRPAQHKASATPSPSDGKQKARDAGAEARE